MQRLVILARLKEGAEQAASELVAEGPPFDPVELGLVRHAVYISATEVIFVFEGEEVEWRVDDLVDDPFRWPVQAAFEQWRPLVEDQPRIARERYYWEREAGPAG